MSTTSVTTFSEFEQLPDQPGKQELIDGELIQLPPPRFPHLELMVRFFDLLRGVFEKSRVWPEAGYRIGDGWLQPDVSVMWPNQQIADGYHIGGPMLAVEILSPGNTAEYIDRKLTLYLSEGTAEVWVVNPKRKSMTVFRAEAGQVVRIVADSAYSSPGIGITLDLPAIFE